MVHALIKWVVSLLIRSRIHRCMEATTKVLSKYFLFNIVWCHMHCNSRSRWKDPVNKTNDEKHDICQSSKTMLIEKETHQSLSQLILFGRHTIWRSILDNAPMHGESESKHSRVAIWGVQRYSFIKTVASKQMTKSYIESVLYNEATKMQD